MESAITNIDNESTGAASPQPTLRVALQNDWEEQIAHLNNELKNKTRQLEEVNKDFEALYHAISHDIKAPLRAVTGYSEILKEDHAAQFNNEVKRLIENIDINAKKLDRLISELLNFSLVTKNEAVFEPVKMEQLAANCVKALLTAEQKEQYNVIIASLPDCTGDAAMLKQVWVNLIGNAIKYSSKKTAPVIEIGFEEDDAMHVYFIRDKGEGFDMRYSSNLFNVFQRLHSDKEFEGIGMGLAFVKRIIFKHAGSVWVQSVPDEGSTFYFSIPKKSF